MRTHSLKARALILCFLFIQAIPCLAEGQQEADLSEAERLLGQQDYAGALKLLTRIQREKPELKELTEGLIKQIIISRTEVYNKSLEEFVHVLYDTRDTEKAKEIYEKLAALIPVPNPVQKTALLNAREGILSIVNETEFKALMDNAADLLAARRYSEAIGRYLLPLVDPQKAGFDLQKSEFDAAVSTLDQRNVQALVAQIVSAGVGAQKDAATISAAPETVRAILAAPMSEQSVSRLDEAFVPLREQSGREASVRALGKSLAAVNESVRVVSVNARKGPFLEYLAWLCQGRDNTNKREGIVYALRPLWSESAISIASDAAQSASEAFKEAVAPFDSGDRGGAVAKFQSAYFYSVLSVKAAALAGGTLEPSGGWAFSADDRKRLSELLAQALTAQEYAAETAAYRTLIGYWDEVNAMPAAQGSTSAQLKTAREALLPLEGRADGIRKDWMVRAAAWAQKANAGLAPPSLSESAKGIADRFSSFALRELQERDLQYALELARIEGSGFEERFAAGVEEKRKGGDLMHGTEGGSLPEGGQFKPRVPAEAIPVFAAATGILEALGSDISAYLARWQAERRYVAQSKRLADVLAPARGLLSKIEGAGGEKTQLDVLRSDAQKQRRSAALKKNEADKAFDDAVALRRKDLASAKAALGDARNLYLESLLLEENRLARNRFENEIPDLIRKINDDINAKYIKEVDALVKDGRDLYNKGEYQKASAQLNKADARWKETQGDTPNADLDYWLATVRNALQVSGSRELALTDSRAPAVTNIIGIANERLAAAASAKKRKDPSWRGLLDEAVRNADLALSAAPEYRVATLLKLKIDQLRDETAGASNARLQIEEYIRRARAILKQEPKGKDVQKEREIYFALRDYQELLGLYPELRAAPELKAAVAELPNIITEVEIDLGIRTRPLTAAQLRDARAFFNNSIKIYKQDDKRTYSLALNEIEKALAINPNFDEARSKRTEILIQMGSAEVGILSKSDLARFYEAQDRFNGGDWPSAYTITRDLLDRGNNRNYPPLVDLFERARRKVGL